MTDPLVIEARARRRSRGSANPAGAEMRQSNYRQLRNQFTPQRLFSDDRIAAIHDAALRVLQELGMRVLLPEARRIFAAAGALVDESTGIVRIGSDIVAAVLASAPKSFRARGGERARDFVFETGALTFLGGCGAPNVSDLARGRRPGTLADLEDLIRLSQSFDVLHLIGPFVEAQDVENHLRHYAFMRAQLTLSDKFPNVYARGTPQTHDCFEMVRLARGLSESDFASAAHCYTVINTNSPRQLDIPMAQGIIDFARAGQVLIVTPFCLAGAMAPITVAGALTLQHADALAGLTLTQLVRTGAPVVYGSFSSNVDMKSGSPAFGTPEHVKATIGAGQLARHIGLPWRSGAGSASPAPDVQAAQETQFGLWGSVLAGATVCIHAAGWLEGGLSVSFEKWITDVEALQTIAELCDATPGDDDAIGFDAIAEVAPGGHFFAAQHTMSRYRTAFYEPIVADLSNYGNWMEAGAKTATHRASEVWRRKLAEFQPPTSAANAKEALDAFVAKRSAEGGSAPVS
jgi:trimethylamine---corrinoid protein Co-methyltransferase